MRIASVWRYPVKSMQGERLSSAFLTKRGIPGDRGWAVFDEERQGVTNAKRLPVLRTARPRYLEEPVAGEASPPIEIALPDGSVARTGAALSAWLGRAVTLRGLGPVGAAAAARLTMDMETPEVQRALGGLEPGEPEADYSALPADRLRALRHDNF